MFTNFKNAMLDSKFQTTLIQNIAGAVIISTITTVLPVAIKAVQGALESKIAEMKAAEVIQGEVVRNPAQ